MKEILSSTNARRRRRRRRRQVDSEIVSILDRFRPGDLAIDYVKAAPPPPGTPPDRRNWSSKDPPCALSEKERE